MGKDKLLELRKKKAQNKLDQHNQLVEAQKNVADSITKLANSIDNSKDADLKEIGRLFNDLKSSMTFKKEIESLEKSLSKVANKKVEIKDIDKLTKAIGNIKNEAVAQAVDRLVTKLDNQTVSQKPEDYVPMRRVIKFGDRFVFDDDKMQVSVGGGGGGSSVQQPLIRTGEAGQAIAVVNPDGTPIQGGGGGGDVTVNNFPSEYPLPEEQITTLTPQTNALTNEQLRAEDVGVDTGLDQPTTPNDIQPVNQISATPYIDISASITVKTIKNSSGVLHSIAAINVNNYDCVALFYDVSGTVTVGTTPPDYALFIPKGDGTNRGASSEQHNVPIEFGNAIKYAVVQLNLTDVDSDITLTGVYS